MPMSKQEIFDTVAAHLLSQQKKSIKPNTNSCLYRGPDDTKCAAGVLIPDEVYHQYDIKHETLTEEQREDLKNSNYQTNWLEGKGSDAAEVEEALTKSGVYNGESKDERAKKQKLLRALQNIHDTEIVPRWSERLRQIAEKFELTHSVLDNYYTPNR